MFIRVCFEEDIHENNHELINKTHVQAKYIKKISEYRDIGMLYVDCILVGQHYRHLTCILYNRLAKMSQYAGNAGPNCRCRAQPFFNTIDVMPENMTCSCDNLNMFPIYQVEMKDGSKYIVHPKDAEQIKIN